MENNNTSVVLHGNGSIQPVKCELLLESSTLTGIQENLFACTCSFKVIPLSTGFS